jgi:lipid II:glycine glycyltransferase (peptidoglycan interpeptide bridge formation enzyme)
MRNARQRGCVEYDLYGVDAFERRDHLYAGITRFKKQWGGAVYRRIGARDYVFYDRLAELLIDRFAVEGPTR